jgi:hypothetical protein
MAIEKVIFGCLAFIQDRNIENKFIDFGRQMYSFVFCAVKLYVGIVV